MKLIGVSLLIFFLCHECWLQDLPKPSFPGSNQWNILTLCYNDTLADRWMTCAESRLIVINSAKFGFSRGYQYHPDMTLCPTADNDCVIEDPAVACDGSSRCQLGAFTLPKLMKNISHCSSGSSEIPEPIQANYITYNYSCLAVDVWTPLNICSEKQVDITRQGHIISPGFPLNFGPTVSTCSCLIQSSEPATIRYYGYRTYLGDRRYCASHLHVIDHTRTNEILYNECSPSSSNYFDILAAPSALSGIHFVNVGGETSSTGLFWIGFVADREVEIECSATSSNIGKLPFSYSTTLIPTTDGSNILNTVISSADVSNPLYPMGMVIAITVMTTLAITAICIGSMVLIVKHRNGSLKDVSMQVSRTINSAFPVVELSQNRSDHNKVYTIGSDLPIYRGPSNETSAISEYEPTYHSINDEDNNSVRMKGDHRSDNEKPKTMEMQLDARPISYASVDSHCSNHSHAKLDCGGQNTSSAQPYMNFTENKRDSPEIDTIDRNVSFDRDLPNFQIYEEKEKRPELCSGDNRLLSYASTDQNISDLRHSKPNCDGFSYVEPDKDKTFEAKNHKADCHSHGNVEEEARNNQEDSTNNYDTIYYDDTKLPDVGDN